MLQSQLFPREAEKNTPEMEWHVLPLVSNHWSLCTFVHQSWRLMTLGNHECPSAAWLAPDHVSCVENLGQVLQGERWKEFLLTTHWE